MRAFAPEDAIEPRALSGPSSCAPEAVPATLAIRIRNDRLLRPALLSSGVCSPSFEVSVMRRRVGNTPNNHKRVDVRRTPGAAQDSGTTGRAERCELDGNVATLSDVGRSPSCGPRRPADLCRGHP